MPADRIYDEIRRRLAQRVAVDYGRQLRSFGEGAPGRSVADVAGLTVVSFGVDEPWGLQVVAMSEPPDAGAVGEAVGWCRDTAGREPQVMVRVADRQALADYEVVDELPAFAAPPGGEQQAVDVSPATDVEEFRSVYAASFGMPEDLAARLVVEADLQKHAHLLGRVDGRAVACAQLRVAQDLAHVNGVGVLPGGRGRGYGAAMMVACRAEAARLGCELVWLNASAASVGFYETIGFELVDTHVALRSASGK